MHEMLVQLMMPLVCLLISMGIVVSALVSLSAAAGSSPLGGPGYQGGSSWAA